MKLLKNLWEWFLKFIRKHTELFSSEIYNKQDIIFGFKEFRCGKNMSKSKYVSL